MNAHIRMGEANKVEVYATNKQVVPSQYEYTLHELPKHQKKILLNLNLMTASAQPGTGNWARRPCSNNNNALLYETPFTQKCMCVCVCVCDELSAAH